MIWFPLTEVRAENLDLLHIYMDPFIQYSYLASIIFFIALYKAFRLLGYIRRNKVFTNDAVKMVSSISKCAIALSILIVVAGIYIKLFHAKEDDPAGFLALCIITTFISIVIVIAASVFKNILKNGMDICIENELLKKELNK